MITYSEAQTLITQHAQPLGVEEVPLQQALKRVLAEDVTSRVALPPFANSAMDGFVCRTEDRECAILTCVGQIAAGAAVPHESLAPQTCLEIMTGAPVPPGEVTVIPVEHTQRVGDEVHIQQPVNAGRHVRHAGEDVEQGQLLLKAGEMLQAAHIGLLAAIGQSYVNVYRQPKVAVLTTGNEVVADLTQELQPGQIYNSSYFYLQSMLPQYGAQVVYTTVLEDDAAKAEKVFNMLFEQEVDVIITTGAVSAGQYDFIPALWRKLGGATYFHKVRQRPGKPILCGAKGATWLLGLPGNPVSTMAGIRFLGGTLLRALQGLPVERPLLATLATPATSKHGFHHFQKGLLYQQHGQNYVEALPGQASFQLSPFAMANAWVVVPEDVEQLSVGETVEVFPQVWGEYCDEIKEKETCNDRQNAA